MSEPAFQSTPISEPASSGKSGAAKPASPSARHFIANLPDVPTIAQKVKFFTARDTFIADELPNLLPIEAESAIKFDVWIALLFKDIVDIDREKWELADRLWAINSALSQQEQRRQNGQVYVRLDPFEDGKFILSIVQPEQRERV